jgi:replicative DNA helicase
MLDYKVKKILGIVSEEVFKRTDTPDLPTGITNLDNMIWGLKRKELTIIAGRTSHFKTALMLQIAWNLADNGKKVAIFSMEMSKEAICERLISNHCGVTSEQIERNQIDEVTKKNIRSFVEYMPDIEFYIHDDRGFKFEDIEEYCKVQKPDVLFIDYIQMISAMGGEREAFGEYCRKMKVYSKQYNVAIVLGSQANRASVAEKIPEAPRLENCKGSGVIEENPDVVLMVHYPYKYDNMANREEYQIVVAKKRNGRTGHITVKIEPQYYRIS